MRISNSFTVRLPRLFVQLGDANYRMPAVDSSPYDGSASSLTLNSTCRTPSHLFLSIGMQGKDLLVALARHSALLILHVISRHLPGTGYSGDWVKDCGIGTYRKWPPCLPPPQCPLGLLRSQAGQPFRSRCPRFRGFRHPTTRNHPDRGDGTQPFPGVHWCPLFTRAAGCPRSDGWCLPDFRARFGSN